MTFENYGSVWSTDRFLPLSSFSSLDRLEMGKWFSWLTGFTGYYLKTMRTLNFGKLHEQNLLKEHVILHLIHLFVLPDKNVISKLQKRPRFFRETK